MYGARGWVAHHNTDLWRAAAPDRRPELGHVADGRRMALPAPVGPLRLQRRWKFLATHLSGAERRLAILPRLRSSKSRSTGGSSPTRRSRRRTGIRRRRPSAPGRRWTCKSCATSSPTRSQAAEILGVDEDFAGSSPAARARLAPNQIGGGASSRNGSKIGTEAPDMHHRHVSHLYGLFPGRADHRARHPGTRRGRAEVTGACAATAHRLGDGLADQPAGRSCATANTPTAS